jgi:hypothetical protein
VINKWVALPQAGFNGSLPTFGSSANGVSSNGTTQGNGTPITAALTRVTTVAAVNGAVTLPAALPGMRLRITNANGGNTANIFPAANETINSAAANTSVQLAANKTVELSCAVAGAWDVLLSA